MTDPNANNSPEPLQFDRAVDAGAPETDAPADGGGTMVCSNCNEPIKTYYYHVDGSAMCAKCKQIAERSSQTQRSRGAFMKAFLLGGLAAVIGAAIYYGVIAITNFEIGLVAILIGFMVGAAVRIGAAGGGRRFQVMALVLTYFSVGLAYTPLAIKGAMQAGKASADSSVVADSSDLDRDADSVAATGDSASVVLAAQLADSGTGATGDTKVGLGGALLGLAIVVIGGFLMVFALPVLAVLGSLPSGLISALIIALGMHQAWKMTAAHLVSITGPYKVGDAPPGAAAAPEPVPTPAA